MVQNIQVNKYNTPPKQKNKNHMIISINIEKALKNSTSFYYNNNNNNKEPLNKSSIEETYLNIIKPSLTNHS